MSSILNITFPVFALIAIGFAVTRTGLFRPRDMRVLGQYVLNIALPALLFNAVSSRRFDEVLNPSYLAAYLVAGLATMAIGFVWFGIRRAGPARRAIGTLGVATPNSGFIGFPMMLMLFPDKAGLILAMNMLVENFALIPAGLLLLDLSRRGSARSLVVALGSVLWGLLRRPMVIGLLLGLLVSITDTPVPAVATRLLGLVASSASAVSLFVIGGSLVGLPMRGNRLLAAEIAIGKLLLHPAMAFAALALGPALGFAVLPDDLSTALILSAAMPMMGIYTALAMDYGHEGLASLAMLLATTGAFLTLTAFLSVLGV